VPALAPLVAAVLVIWQLAVMWLYYVGKLLMQRAARVSEFVADDAAVRWGYGAELLALYRSLPGEAPAGRLERWLADHPPMPERIARIEAAGATLAVPAGG
jgi:Zn-dependent protease with chaperone function